MKDRVYNINTLLELVDQRVRAEELIKESILEYAKTGDLDSCGVDAASRAYGESVRDTIRALEEQF